MSTTNRRFDIDWLRVIAIGLLLIYHLVIAFQPTGIMIGFIANEKPWEPLLIPMAMLNVWRIPLLFFVSGMGVYFAIQNRNWKQLLVERASRILIPFLFGMFIIVPVFIYLWQYYYQFDLIYSYHPGHLWFLRNIFVYVVVLLPVIFYLKRNEDGQLVTWIKRILSSPLGLIPVITVFIVEAVLLDPNPFILYATTWHGFSLGLLAFFFGFCFVLSGRPFWEMILKWRWLFFSAAAILFTVRLVQFQLNAPNYLVSIESTCWIISVFAFGYKYLNHPSKILSYLSQAAYPVYILHAIFLQLGCLLILPLDIEDAFKFIFVLLFTFIGCFTLYELVIRRVNIIRPLFGLSFSPGQEKLSKKLLLHI